MDTQIPEIPTVYVKFTLHEQIAILSARAKHHFLKTHTRQIIIKIYQCSNNVLLSDSTFFSVNAWKLNKPSRHSLHAV